MPRRRLGLIPAIPQEQYDSWFHLRRYLYLSEGETRTLCRTAPLPEAKVKEKKTPTGGGGRQLSKRIVPDDHVQRTWKVRIFPTREQKPILKLWIKAARTTWNWAIGVSRRQFKKHGKTFVSTTNFVGLKKNFVTCNPARMPKRLRWLKDTPCSVREATIQEMAKAYEAEFKRYHESGDFTAPAFRSAKRPEASITVPPQNWNKQPDRRWQCYVTMLPNEGKLRVRQRDQRRVLDRYPEGPVREVKIVHRAGKWYMHVPIYKAVTDLPNEANGHLVSLDPGSNPLMTYYSPTHMETGSFGVQEDVNTLNRFQEKIDEISAKLTSPLSKPQIRDLKRKRLLLHERIQNRARECSNKLTLFLTRRYQYVHASTFAVEEMVPKQQGVKRRKINKKATRDLLTWCHGPFKRALAMKVEEVRGLVVEFCTEEYTTMTCDNCGILQKVDSKKFHCVTCGHRVHRDVHGARGHALKNCVGKYTWVAPR